MKETKLGEFEEVLLLLVGILGEEAYSFKVAEEFESQTKREVSIGAGGKGLSRIGNGPGHGRAGRAQEAHLHHHCQWPTSTGDFKRL